jgi:hypothetical protein
MSTAHEISSCEVCGNTSLQSVLDLGRHPLCDDLVPVGDTRECIEYPIEILYCDRCATAHQRFQVPKRDLFPKSYHYRSRFTADVLDGMAALVDSCANRLGGLTGRIVLDVGCNDGSLLGFFQRQGAKTVGLEPTGAYEDGIGQGHALYNEYLSPEVARDIRVRHGSPDIITFTNVFAHIEDLPQVIEALKELATAKTMLVIENHYLGSVLDRHQFDTFYHEHPRTYSLTSFVRIAQSLAMPLTGVEFPSRYGGNIRIFIGGPAAAGDAPAIGDVLAREAKFRARFAQLAANVAQWQATMSPRLADLAAQHGPLPGKAFPGRAAILVKLLGLDTRTLDVVHEKPGSMKIGNYLPGTRIPIASDERLLALAPPPPVIVNLAWHISAEIRGYLARAGYAGEVVDLLDPREFPSG